jgi:hypothetical protein
MQHEREGRLMPHKPRRDTHRTASPAQVERLRAATGGTYSTPVTVRHYRDHLRARADHPETTIEGYCRAYAQAARRDAQAHTDETLWGRALSEAIHAQRGRAQGDVIH